MKIPTGKNPNLSLYLVNVLSEVINSRLKKALKKVGHEKVSPRDLGILVHVARASEGQMDLTDAYSKEVRSRSTVSDIAARLEKLGYLSKQPAANNAKKVVLVAKDKAGELHDSITEEISDIVDQLYKGFTEEEKIMHMELTARAFDNLTGNNENTAES